MVATAWWGFCFIGVATYGANIGANLILNRAIYKIETFEQADTGRSNIQIFSTFFFFHFKIVCLNMSVNRLTSTEE